MLYVVSEAASIGKVQGGGPTNGSDLPKSGFLPPRARLHLLHIGSPHTTPATGHVGRGWWCFAAAACLSRLQIASPQVPLYGLFRAFLSLGRSSKVCPGPEIPGGNMNFLPCPHLPRTVMGL